MPAWPFILAACPLAAPAEPMFHLMQIEQVQGGVAGDPAAQAIQLRMRDEGENQLQSADLVAWAPIEHALPVLLIAFDAPVPNGATGDRVLVATSAFCRLLDPPIEPDFLLTNPIPPEWLAAGSITFGGGGSLYWRLSWGGAAYQGSTTGLPFNDADGEFGPPFPCGLPDGGGLALRFQGPAEAFSTSNLADYDYAAAPTVWTNNAGTSAVLAAAPLCPADVTGDGAVAVADLVAVILGWGGCAGPADVNGDGGVDVQDLTAVVLAWGPCG
jgi:hypothetical protein